MARLLLAGYFGAGNLGDDAILLGLIAGLERAGGGHEYVVMSGSPDFMVRNHNLRGFDRRDMKTFGEEIRLCDAVVFAGGSIFQDVTSLRSVAYYSEIVKRAKKAGKKVLLLGQGVGPLNRMFGKKMAAEAFSMADVVAVRDPGSMATLQSLGVKRPIRVTADCALLLPAPPDTGEAGFQVGGMKSVGVAPRPWGKGKEVVKLFSDFCQMLFRSQIVPVLIEMDRNEDGPLIDAIEKEAGGRISHLMKSGSPVTIQQRLARMDGMVSMRLHGAILAASVGIPPLIVSYDPKTTAFGRLLDVGTPLPIEKLTAQRLFDVFMEHQKARERNNQILARKLAEQRKLAEGNVELLLAALGSAATIGLN